MTNLRNLFEIDDFDLLDEELEVTLIRGDKEKEISVPRARFEKWLETSGRLSYCNDWSDYAGEHQQETGTISIENYWKDIMIDKRQDLYDFIILKMMDVRKIFDIETPLKSILNSFKAAI